MVLGFFNKFGVWYFFMIIFLELYYFFSLFGVDVLCLVFVVFWVRGFVIGINVERVIYVFF